MQVLLVCACNLCVKVFLCLVYINTDLNVDIRAIIIQTDFLMCSLVSVYETVEG